VDSTVMPQDMNIIRIHVSELANGRLAINALGPQTVVGGAEAAKPSPNPLLTTNEPKPNHSPPATTVKTTTKTEHIPLMGTNKKTKITITAEESSTCACC